MATKNYKFIKTKDRSYNAAKIIIPIVIDLVGKPNSVLDLGGGVGCWVKVFKEKGIKEIICVDSPKINKENLIILENEFVGCNLKNDFPKINKKFELSLCIEFGEHLPKKKSGKIVDFLTSHSDIVVFSSAIPRQGGLGHKNERRPDFWKNLFEERGFVRLDVIRPKIMFNKKIPFYLRQNIYIFKKGTQENNFIPDDFELVHKKILNSPLSLKEILIAFPKSFLILPKAIKRKWKKNKK